MANPIVSRTELAVGSVPMTVGGVVKKSAFLLALAAVSGFGVFFYALMGGISVSMLYPRLGGPVCRHGLRLGISI